MFDNIRNKYRGQVFSLYLLMFVIWALFCLAPIGYAAMDMAASGKDEVHYGTGFALWFFVAIAAFVGAVVSLLAQPFDFWILSSLLSGRDATDDDRRIVETLDRLALATGDPAPRLKIIPNNTVNAIAVGRRKRSTLFVTAGATQLPQDELEALLAIPLARIAMGRASCTRMVLLVAMPTLLLFALIKWFLKHWRFWIVVAPASFVLAMAGVVALNHLPPWLQTVVVLSFIIPIVLGFCFIGSGPWTLAWWAFIAGTVVMTDQISRPAAMDADVGAVTLTRYPPPLVKLLGDALTKPTAQSSFVFATSSLWVLPYGSNKTRKLSERIVAMQTFARTRSDAA